MAAPIFTVNALGSILSLAYAYGGINLIGRPFSGLGAFASAGLWLLIDAGTGRSGNSLALG